MKKTRLLLATIALSMACFTYGQEHNEHAVSENKSGMTASFALHELKTGNLRFLGDSLKNTDYRNQIEKTKDSQKPHTLVMTCMDSRVPPEIIFDQGIGNIFVLRVAGNVEDENMLGSMEYAVEHTGSKLLVVMGHSHCGAVKGAVQNAGSGMLTQLLDQIKPAIPADHKDPDLIEKTVKNNVKLTIADILAKSHSIREMVDDHKIVILGAFYDIETGVVTFME